MSIANTRPGSVTSILNEYKSKNVTAEEAVRCIKSHDKILIHSFCAFPTKIVEALVNRKDELDRVEIFHALTVGELSYLRPGMEKHFIHNATFIGKNSREAVQDGRADFIPIFLSEIPLLYKSGEIKLDAALIHVSPPDEHGFCSLGVEVGLTKTGAESARVIIAQVNKKMPRTLGDSFIHVSKINYMVEADEDIKELPQSEDLSPDMLNIYSRIGEHIADLIEDGSTLQI
jgi:4-hydroxybutyrate CoA-transferase